LIVSEHTKGRGVTGKPTGMEWWSFE